MCGGTGAREREVQQAQGLSPRVRGNRPPGILRPRRNGSIPACAGEPATRRSALSPTAVYPRVCGGTLLIGAAVLLAIGLSPRVRGNPPGKGVPVGVVRSIPACAGEPNRVQIHQRHHPVYPRVCGGTAIVASTWAFRCGLSPRVRGNPPAAERTMTTTRSIPACAGGTASSALAMLERIGLSPRVRGNHRPVDRACRHRGSIPACAGEPRARSCGGAGSAVYPRVCGGTAQCSGRRPRQPGLSPRVRGNLRGVLAALPPVGSIPACAGEPIS